MISRLRTILLTSCALSLIGVSSPSVVRAEQQPSIEIHLDVLEHLTTPPRVVPAEQYEAAPFRQEASVPPPKPTPSKKKPAVKKPKPIVVAKPEPLPAPVPVPATVPAPKPAALPPAEPVIAEKKQPVPVPVQKPPVMAVVPPVLAPSIAPPSQPAIAPVSTKQLSPADAVVVKPAPIVNLPVTPPPPALPVPPESLKELPPVTPTPPTLPALGNKLSAPALAPPSLPSPPVAVVPPVPPPAKPLAMEAITPPLQKLPDPAATPPAAVPFPPLVAPGQPPAPILPPVTPATGALPSLPSITDADKTPQAPKGSSNAPLPPLTPITGDDKTSKDTAKGTVAINNLPPISAATSTGASPVPQPMVELPGTSAKELPLPAAGAQVTKSSDATSSAEQGSNAPPATPPDLRIPFSETQTDVPLASYSNLDALVQTLSKNPNARVSVIAYAGGPDSAGVYPKRVSLARGIAVRNYLTANKGVDIERVHIKALGNKNEGGPADRVDLFIIK